MPPPRIFLKLAKYTAANQGLAGVARHVIDTHFELASLESNGAL
jgi:hypothetical protein